MSTLGERIAIIRGELSMQQFADSLSKCGIKFDKGNMSRYEKGEVNPSYNFFIATNKIFGVNLNWLITGEGEIYTAGVNKKAADLKEEIAKLKEENKTVKKMVGIEAVKYINSQLSLSGKPPKHTSKIHPKKKK